MDWNLEIKKAVEENEEKKQFIKLLRATKRNNIENLINYLETTDFYTAPASTQYHGAHKNGLLLHSLEVYNNLDNLVKVYEVNAKWDELIIIGLLHDVCKTNFYVSSKRNIKENGKWIQADYYSVEDSYPLGHGEKSVIMLMKYIQLTDNEIFCIRWHMMSYDDITKGYAGNLSLTNALNKYPIIALTHAADLFSISQKIKGDSYSHKEARLKLFGT